MSHNIVFPDSPWRPGPWPRPPWAAARPPSPARSAGSSRTSTPPATSCRERRRATAPARSSPARSSTCSTTGRCPATPRARTSVAIAPESVVEAAVMGARMPAAMPMGTEYLAGQVHDRQPRGRRPLHGADLQRDQLHGGDHPAQLHLEQPPDDRDAGVERHPLRGRPGPQGRRLHGHVQGLGRSTRPCTAGTAWTRWATPIPPRASRTPPPASRSRAAA